MEGLFKRLQWLKSWREKLEWANLEAGKHLKAQKFPKV